MKKYIPVILIISVLIIEDAYSQTTFYISNSGNNNNNGTSTSTPWKTLKSFSAGNTYLFKKGDTFYLKVPRVTSSGAVTTVSSYGTGAKPVISMYSKIKSTAWVLYADNIWKVNIRMSSNVTEFITPSPVNCGFIKADGVMYGKRKYSMPDLNGQWQFYCDFDSSIYVYSTANPSTLANSIEVSNDDKIVNPSNYQIISNIKIMG